MLERVDAQLVHALQLSPRAAFRDIADVIGVPERTIARRYHRLRSDGLLRVVGLVDPRVRGEQRWVVRVRCEPDDLPRLADALTLRPEVTHVNVLSGWTELMCVIRAPIAEPREGLMRRLPRTSAVVGIEAELILHTFSDPSPGKWTWTGYGPTLDSAQSAVLLASAETVASSQPAAVGPDDGPLIDALAEDGRSSLAELAKGTGWSPARIRRRIAALEASRILTFGVDVVPERFGFDVNAMIWLTIPPRHLDAVGEQVAAHAEVASVVAVSGPNSLMAIAICRDADELYRYLSRRLATVDHVERVDVRVRSQLLKQSASVVAGGRLFHAAKV
jgi:DNA-binding Lrp family transcriptional regulator